MHVSKHTPVQNKNKQNKKNKTKQENTKKNPIKPGQFCSVWRFLKQMLQKSKKDPTAALDPNPQRILSHTFRISLPVALLQ